MRQRGFTLVELAIVLVIIGLIIGGVLVGQSMIEAARIRAQLTQIGKLNTAVTVFQMKYECLPGDCPNASAYWPGANNGNGNGLIDWTGGVGTTDEIMNVFAHLSLAGVIEGVFSNVASAHAIPDNFPAPKIGRGGMFVWGGNYPGGQFNAWSMMLPASLDLTQGWNWSDPFTPYEAFQIDSKIDDGKPGSGMVQGEDQVFASGQDDCLGDQNYDANTPYSTAPATQSLPVCMLDVGWGQKMEDGWF